jgi:ABC-type transporter Mla subunit MlaD
MDRTRTIESLGTALTDAAKRSDWDLLGVSVRELAPRLEQLRALGPWSEAELAALARLRAAHEGAAAAVAAAGAQLATRLEDMRGNKEGWMAYALTGELDLGNP